MTLGVVLNPGLEWLRDVDALDDASEVLAPSPDLSPAERTAVVRELFENGVDLLLVVGRGAPVRPDWATSGALFALVSDHLNLTGDNPLVGTNDDRWGPRFPDLTDTWDPALRRELREALVGEGVELREGVLAGVADPARTAAELSMLRMMGADMAGEGFVHDAIVARHAGRRIVGLVVLTSGTRLPGETARIETVVRAVASGLATA